MTEREGDSVSTRAQGHHSGGDGPELTDPRRAISSVRGSSLCPHLSLGPLGPSDITACLWLELGARPPMSWLSPPLDSEVC